MDDAQDQIRNLIHRYAHAVDSGRFEILDTLFEHATVRMALGEGEPGPPFAGNTTSQRYRAALIIYADGTPRTRHLVSNTLVEVDRDAGCATARSYNTTLQQVPGRPIEIIATAHYEDTFERVGRVWRFAERVIRQSSIDGIRRDFIGDMSRHTTTRY